MRHLGEGRLDATIAFIHHQPPTQKVELSLASIVLALPLVLPLALFTYVIPATFLAIPMYKTMSVYGLLNAHWAMILAMARSPRMHGTTALQLFRLVYLPLMAPSRWCRTSRPTR